MIQINTAAPGSAAIIEPATWRDLKDLRHLGKVCFPLDFWPIFDLIGVLTFPGVVRIKAIWDEQLIGFIAADNRRSHNIAWIAILGVLPAYRRQGIGSTLLRACEDQIYMPRIRLSVRASNHPAIMLYTNFGYQKHGVWSRYYSDGEDALVLEKTLKKD